MPNLLNYNLTPLELLLTGLLFLLFLFFLYKRFYPKGKRLSEQNSSDEDGAKIKKSSEVYSGGIIAISRSNEVIYANRTSAEMLGLHQYFRAKELAAAAVLKIDKGEPITIYDLIETYQKELRKNGEFTVRATLIQPKSEKEIKIFMAISDKSKSDYIIVLNDLSTEKEISSVRQKDLLTHLPNQNKAIHDIGIMINKMHAERRSFALILISLDSFTELRAMMGYQKTDNLIIGFSENLQYIAKGIDSTIYHTMNNNFLLVVPDINTATEAKEVVKKIEYSLEELMAYSNAMIRLTFSTGISFFPKSGNGIDALIDSAYKALSEAKEKGGGYTVVDEKGLFLKDKNYEITLYNEMIVALKNREFELYYQPLIDMKTDLVWGAEALIRWNHPRRGLVSPAEFIPIAEKTGLIIELGRFVTDEAISQQKKWEIFKFKKIQVSINLTLREIETGDLVDFIIQTLKKHQVSPALVKFEITENIAMSNPEKTKKEFERLNKLGIKLALDDFGTGYSSFGYLNDFSLDTLKVDQSFVTDMVQNEKHRKIVHAMVDLGHNFDLLITAEGIEDKATYDMLKEFGCDIAQGYYFSKPIPVFEFQELIREKESITEQK